jgi:hypothetical protein
MGSEGRLKSSVGKSIQQLFYMPMKIKAGSVTCLCLFADELKINPL